MHKVFSGYIALLLGFVVFSYGFVDPNFPYAPLPALHTLVYEMRGLATSIYVAGVVAFYSFYVYFLRLCARQSISGVTVWKLIGITVGILLFSYPAFSYDIFNYIATAKVLYFYGENPYVVMPIELSNESMLHYMHAPNKTALYGISWIALSGVAHYLGFGSILATIFSFKVLVALSYICLSYIVYLLSKKDALSLAYIALNPLVVIETLISGHNDTVMMFLAVLSFYLVSKRLYIGSAVAFAASVGIKFATIVLAPVYVFVLARKILGKKRNWSSQWLYSSLLMLGVVVLSPFREEVYAWYLIWPLTFAALAKKQVFLRQFLVAVSFGLLLRFAPFILTREWMGSTPYVKLFVTVTPALLLVSWYLLKRSRNT